MSETSAPSVPVSSIAVGQVWTFRGAPGPVTRLVIGAIQDFHSRDAVSVAFTGVPNPADAQGGLIEIPHMPFEASALAADLLELEETGAAAPAGFSEARQSWIREAGGLLSMAPARALAHAVRIAISRARA
ncbi:hypothetical protein SAMN05216548_101544 [Faunimonas pinastri]|uniref:Uncharacterized protein n=1 Tax=Faunimonas pinastri TaxID=1855383 RepID=A0A1H9AWG6_9HYPH|nr:hypothetical protein [Faunimonas pinastri]SEP80969.1 hypothetical protein SAMN05216548_101544 [Faunimonas pinastri]